MSVFLNIKFLGLLFFFGLTSCSSQVKVTKKIYSPEEIQSESKRLNEFFEKEFEKGVNRYPTFSTMLGRRTHYDKLNDISYAFAKESLALDRQSLKKLKTFNYDALDKQTQLSYDLYKERAESYIRDFKYFYHRFFVSQMFGHHSNLPSFMINMHQIANVKEAKDYISRLNAFNKSFNQLVTILKKQHRLNIKMPNFSFDKVIRDSENIIKDYPFQSVKKQSTLYSDFSSKIKNLKMSSSQRKELLDEAKKALVNSVQPGYQKFIAQMKELKKDSPKNKGAWSLPDGKNYYKRSLKNITTTDMTAPEIHNIGIEQVARIQNEMRDIMKTVGFKGNLTDFFNYIKNGQQFYFPNTAQGRKAYLKETNKIIKNITAKSDQLFNIKPKAALKVRPVEAFREKSAGIAFYQGPALNGSRPGIYYVNLSDMSSVAKYDMEALAYHEALPGHHMQISIARELQNIPTFRKIGGYTAYSEGWGLYSEYIPKELGFYKDPYSDFGRLSMEIWRACRLVVDTGIHHYKWSREKAIKYLTDNTPSSQDEIVKGVERYFVMPGQATAYKIGQLKILSLRKMAEQKLGTQFDVRKFHDVILGNGAVPLNALEDQVNTYVKLDLETPAPVKLRAPAEQKNKKR